MIKTKLHWAATLLLLLTVLFNSCTGKATSDEEPVEVIAAKQFNAEELKGLVFYGVEPFWDIRLKDTHAEYRSLNMKGVLTIDYRKNEADTSKLKLSHAMRVKDNHVVEITGVMNHNSVTIRIVKEICSDGMSDYIRPYSVEFIHEQWGVFKGCGRINTN